MNCLRDPGTTLCGPAVAFIENVRTMVKMPILIDDAFVNFDEVSQGQHVPSLGNSGAFRSSSSADPTSRPLLRRGKTTVNGRHSSESSSGMAQLLDLNHGEGFALFVLIKSADIRVARNGNPFIAFLPGSFWQHGWHVLVGH